MNRTNQDTGKLGERIAEKYLSSRGFTMLDRNFSTPFGEIDLVTKRADKIIFFEVKTRISEKFGSPLSAITKDKQKHVLKNCMFYLKKHGLYGKSCRIDAIAINLDKKGELQALKYVKNAIEICET